MGKVYEQAKRFMAKYPMTVGWRIRQNSEVVEKHLNPGEEVLYTFVAQKNNNPFDIVSTAVVALTNERILIGRKRVIVGYFLDSITPDMFDDFKVLSGIIWGKIHIDYVKEFVTLSNISKDALSEIETKISSFMMEQKKKYGLKNNNFSE